MSSSSEAVSEAIQLAFVSPNVPDANLEAANIVDAVAMLAGSASAVAGAITPRGVGAGHDATGGTVTSLTEAVMGVTAGLVQIADAIRSLEAAIEERTDG